MDSGQNLLTGKGATLTCDGASLRTSGQIMKIRIGVAPASNLQDAVPMRSILIDQAAQMLRVSRRTIYNRIREGQLETVRTVGGSQRVLMESIEALLPRSDDAFRGPAAGVSGTGPSGKSPAP